MSLVEGPLHRYVVYEGGSRPKLANCLTLSRLLAIPMILLLLAGGHDVIALQVYIVAVLTDAADGFVARRLDSATAFGARLDAVVDNIFSLAILPFLALAFPSLLRGHPIALAALFGVPVLYLGLSWLWKRQLLMYHFQSAKIGALLLFLAWPLMTLTGWTGWVVLAAVAVCASRLEQIGYMARGGLDLDASHGFVEVHRDAVTPWQNEAKRPASSDTEFSVSRPTEVSWYARTPLERGPVVSYPDPERNAIGVPTGNYAPYRAIGALRQTLATDHVADYSLTAPVAEIGPHAAWFEPGRIVALDPFGHVTAREFSSAIAHGRSIRPSIAVAAGTLDIPEIASALTSGRLEADGDILLGNGQAKVTKIAIEPVWYLPGLAARLAVSEARLRRALFAHSGGSYPQLIERPDLPIFHPPIGGQSVYLFGNPNKLGRLDTKITCRIHDECNSSDVFGSTLCTCRPYLAFSIEEAIRQAKAGGVGVVVYNRKEGRCLGEVTKYLVYNARERDPRGDRPEDYFDHTEAIAGTRDLREQSLAVDVLHWLGICRVDRWISMSNLKSAAARAQGIEIVEQIALPEALVPSHAHVEIEAKTAVGYFSG